MNHLPGKLLAVGGLLLLVVAAGCERFKAIVPSIAPSNSSTSQSNVASTSTEKSPIPADPDEPAVKALVEQALAARIRGDSATLQKLCQPSLAAKFTSLQPRVLEFKVRKVEVLSRTAKAEVWTRDPGLDPRDNQSLVTYDLVRTADAWRIADARNATFTADLTTKLLETK